jgi:hypothetical protein
MNKVTKNKAYNKTNELLMSKVNIKSFEKNPIKGGTPAIEKIISVMIVK